MIGGGALVPPPSSRHPDANQDQATGACAPQILICIRMTVGGEQIISLSTSPTDKDMGRIMSMLKQRYPGRMDFSNASGIVRQQLV
ncbi:GatB/YqeY domain-containing protein [Thalassobaculum sp.]|uniref:GatB/YqeY domain-containing protein n=1 Tax=Thalassobaculum sp. TaxID=2022740 RepID=UPI003B5C78B3